MDLDSFEIRDLIAKALNQLSAQFRQVFILREIHGLSYKQIADIEKISINTVKTRLFRAKKYLKKLINQELPINI